MSTEKMYNVRNRSASVVVYSIPEDNLRREFQPSEIKKIKHSELEKLSYQPGGPALMENFLAIEDSEMLKELGIHAEPEYFLTEPQIIDLINNGSFDSWCDCLDFAPVGVIDLLKQLSVSIPLNDSRKREALKSKTGFDVSAALKHNEEDKENENILTQAKPERRVKTEEPAAAPERRTTPTYNIIKK